MHRKVCCFIFGIFFARALPFTTLFRFSTWPQIPSFVARLRNCIRCSIDFLQRRNYCQHCHHLYCLHLVTARHIQFLLKSPDPKNDASIKEGHLLTTQSHTETHQPCHKAGTNQGCSRELFTGTTQDSGVKLISLGSPSGWILVTIKKTGRV